MDAIDVGDRLFGRRARLLVALWIHRRGDPGEETFFQTQVAASRGLPQSNVREELSRLAALGMITRLPRADATRRVYYLRLPSPVWSIIAAASAALTEQSASESTGAPRHLVTK